LNFFRALHLKFWGGLSDTDFINKLLSEGLDAFICPALTLLMLAPILLNLWKKWVPDSSKSWNLTAK